MAYLGHVTHHCHEQIIIPDGIDLVIHTGDASNWRDPYRNEPEMNNFLTWYTALPIKHKVFVAGNHDTSIERGLITKEHFEACDIHYLFNESVEINGLNIWGSPHTPTFGDWAFMKARHKLGQVWESIPDDTDIIATHGPPLGMLDITNRRDNLSEQCGDRSLLKAVMRIEPKLVCFGHIHNTKDIINAGTKQVAGLQTIFSNGSCSTDGKWGAITSHGNIINLSTYRDY